MVEMTPVKSSNIAAIGHDADNCELHVKFLSGPTYIHSDVSADHHAALMAAESVGKHYGATFRGNPNHPHRQLESS